MSISVGALVLLSTLCRAQAQVIIKQYIEGTGFNKAIQIENMGTGAAVKLPRTTIVFFPVLWVRFTQQGHWQRS
jgi:hypothetical protein